LRERRYDPIAFAERVGFALDYEPVSLD